MNTVEEIQEVCKPIVGEEWTFEDIYDLKDDIEFEFEENPDRYLVCYDNPKELELGWRCVKTGDSWIIRITCLKNTIHNGDLDPKVFYSVESREEWANSLKGE